jgi:vitamin B12 transporter
MVREVTSNITILDEEVVKKSSAANLGRLLEQQGFQIEGYPGGGLRLNIRGIGQGTSSTELTSRVLVLLNGRRIITNSMDFTGLANIERIEIIKGPAALQYGPSAMGGVLNIITKRGQDKMEGYAEIGMGSFSLDKEKAAISGKFNNFDFSTGIFHFKQDDYKTSYGWVWEHTSPGDTFNTNVNMGYTIADNHRIGIDYYYLFINEAECPADEIPYWNPRPTYNDSFSKHDNQVSNIAFTYDGSTKNHTFSWSASYGTGKNRDNANWGDTFFDVDTILGQLNYDSKYLTITGGFDYVKYHHTGTYATNSFISDSGVFLAAKLRFLEETLIFSLGGRYDQYKLEIVPTSYNQSTNNFVPSVGVAYLPVEWLKLRANYAEGFAMPTPTQMAGNQTNLPNDKLKPEESKTFELGADISYDFVTASVTFFHTLWRNKIVSNAVPGSFNPGNNNPWFRNENIEGALIEGFEFSLNVDLGYAFDQDFTLMPYFNLTYLPKRLNKDYSGSTSSVQAYGFDTLYRIAKVTLATGITFTHPDINLTTTLSARYMGSTLSRNYGTGEETPVTYINYDNGPIVDFSIQKRLFDWDEKGYLNAMGQLNNVFNAYDQPYINYPRPGRNFYLGLSYEF